MMTGMSLRGFIRPAAFAFLASIAACGGDDAGPTESEPTIASVSITPDSASILVGESQSFAATGLSAADVELEPVSVSWSSDDESVATVDANGVATGVSAGSAQISATLDGVSASVTLRVHEPSPARVEISPDTADLLVHQTESFTAVAYDDADEELTGRSVDWSSGNTAVATVNESGVVTARGPGSAQITATIDGTSASVTISVRENPVLPTSYENFKEVGLEPHSIPLPATEHWGYHELARAYGDFFGNGELDMFTATVDYDVDASPETAARAVYRFWRREGNAYVEDNSILAASVPACLHSRKALVADFNLDGRPDVFIACHGYDRAPFPGERNQVILSTGETGYSLQQAAPDVGFWHGASAADLNDDGYPDVVAVAGGQRALFVNDRNGGFQRAAIAPLPGDETFGFGGSTYFSVELVDVDEDGHVDLVMGGHEWDEGFGDTPTGVWLNPGTNDFSGVEPVVIDAVENEGVVVDFTVTGTGPSRTLWISRTSGGDGTFYQSAVLQRYDWSTGSAEVVVNERPALWVPWIIPYPVGGALHIGSDDLRTPMDYAVE